MVQTASPSDHQDECTEHKCISLNAESTIHSRKGTQGRRETQFKSLNQLLASRRHPVIFGLDQDDHFRVNSTPVFTNDDRRNMLLGVLPHYEEALQRIDSSSAQPPSANKTHLNARISLADLQHQLKGCDPLPASYHAPKIQSRKRSGKRSGKRRRSNSGHASSYRRSHKTSPVVEDFDDVDEDDMTEIEIGNSDRVREYLSDAFASFQQINCRTLCKSWIRTIEPKKQVNHPYNGNLKVRGAQRSPTSDSCVQKELDPEETKPKWWPSKDICPHKEPDHIKKEERLGLLCHILMSTQDLHQCSTLDLKNATMADKAKIKPPGKVSILDDVWKIGTQLERFKRDEIDGTAAVYVTARKEEARMNRGGGRSRKPADDDDDSDDEESDEDSDSASDAAKSLIAKTPLASASSVQYLKPEQTSVVPPIHLDTRGYGPSSSTRRFRDPDNEVDYQSHQVRYSMPLEVSATLGEASVHEPSRQVFGGENFAENLYGNMQDIRGHGNLFSTEDQQAIGHWAIPAAPEQYPMHYLREPSLPPAVNPLDRDHIFGPLPLWKTSQTSPPFH